MTYSLLTPYYVKYLKPMVQKRKHELQSLAQVMCVLAMYNKAQVERISNREFKLVSFQDWIQSGDLSWWDLYNVSPVHKPPSNKNWIIYSHGV